MMRKNSISCEKSSQKNVLQVFNISQKNAKFDIESDIEKSSFSEKLDKNNWTSKIDLFHTLGLGFFRKTYNLMNRRANDLMDSMEANVADGHLNRDFDFLLEKLQNLGRRSQVPS